MISTTTPPRPIHWSFLLGFAFLLTLLLFYIDEGRYTLDGLFQTGNIVGMSLYLLGLIVGLFGMNAVLERRPPSPERTAVILGIGSIAGVALTVLFIFCLRGFSLPA